MNGSCIVIITKKVYSKVVMYIVRKLQNIFNYKTKLLLLRK